jgi:hypothetical protein
MFGNGAAIALQKLDHFLGGNLAVRALMEPRERGELAPLVAKVHDGHTADSEDVANLGC